MDTRNWWVVQIFEYYLNIDESYHILSGFANAKTGDIQKDEFKHLLVSRGSDSIPFESNRALEDTVYKGFKSPLFFIRR